MIGEVRNFCKDCGRGFPTAQALSDHFCEAFYLLRLKDLKPNCPFHLNCNANRPVIETRRQIRREKAEIRARMNREIERDHEPGPAGYGEPSKEW